jgi:hypothetical protein
MDKCLKEGLHFGPEHVRCKVEKMKVCYSLNGMENRRIVTGAHDVCGRNYTLSAMQRA